MIKIIHTADWHIGKMLHRQSLDAEITRFMEWLLKEISRREADVLLISGDIFDLANPSNHDTKLYYDFLASILKTGVTVIITGGNHDSVSLLQAPAALLSAMNIHIIGGLPESTEDAVIPIKAKDGTLACLVLAVPFLREKDIRFSGSVSESVEKTEAIPIAVRRIYHEMILAGRQKFGNNIPVIGMGHLYMRGSITSESERDIHIGNLSGVEVDNIPAEIDYLALGHIHKPQRVAKQNHIRYSGSPVYLDFSEVGYEKQIVEIVIEDHKINNIQSIPVPIFRHLITFRGTLDDVRGALSSYSSPSILPTFVSLEVTEPTYNFLQMGMLAELASSKNDAYMVIHHKIHFGDMLQNSSDVAEQDPIEEITTLKMLEMRLEAETLEENLRKKMTLTYQEIVDSILQNPE
jgi:exonuclease SbcD